MRRFFLLVLVPLATACDPQQPDGYGQSWYAPPPNNVLPVDIDTDALLAPLPGEEVAVNVAYATGGNWHLDITCDTSKSGYSCAWDIVVSVADTETLTTTDSRPHQIDAGSYRIVLPQQTGGDSFDFVSAPRQAMRVDVILDGVHGNWANHELDAWMVGWVERNEARYGAPSNPIDFVPTTP